MKRSLKYVSGLVLGCVATCSVYATEMYVKGSIDLPVYRSFKTNSGRHTPSFKVGGSAAVGMKINRYISTDLEVGFSSLSVKTKAAGAPAATSLKSTTAIANLIFYPLVNHFHGFKPFVGFGVGGAWNKMGGGSSQITIPGYTDALGQAFPPQIISTTSQGLKVRNIAYQLIAGAEFSVNRDFSLFADVRGKHLGNFKQINNATGASPTTVSGKLQVLTFNLGAKFIW